ncbi:MAG TPA: AroM family protein [Propionibacteriaceae bacterium]|nr:AroM family protein [Propionibacteriaceae bacterium]
MTKLGVVTIGQAPRPDMVPEMARHWAGVEVVERGALDDLTPTQVRASEVREGDEVLTSRMRDGSSAVFGRDLALPGLQAAITGLEEEGCDAVLLVCTGVFPPFQHERPLYRASPLIVSGVEGLADGVVGVICPLPEQQADSVAKFASRTVLTAVADPYGASSDVFAAAASDLVARGAEMIVMDCMGYTAAHRDLVRDAAPGIPVVTARSVVARLVAEVVAA